MPPKHWRRVAFAIGLACLWAAPAFVQSNLKIVVIAGEDAVNVIQQKTAVAPIVEVRDRNDLPVAGATVVFTLNGSGATFAGTQTLTLVTNAAGQATATGLTPTTAGALRITARATFQGQTATATIAQSNVMTAAEAAKLSQPGSAGAASGGGLSAGKVLAIVGGLGAVGGGVAVAAGGSADDSASTQTTGNSSASTTGAASTTPANTTPSTPTTPVPVANSAPVINAVMASPAVGLVAVTPVAFDVQATDADDNQLTFFWQFPDGSTSDQRAFSRVFNVGGIHNSRVTVRDGITATSREFSFELRTLNGEWELSLGNATGQVYFTFSQSGTTISGSYTTPGVTCPLMGFLRASAPQVNFNVPPCSYILLASPRPDIAPVRGILEIQDAELQLGADLSSLSGTAVQLTTTISSSGSVLSRSMPTTLQLRKR